MCIFCTGHVFVRFVSRNDVFAGERLPKTDYLQGQQKSRAGAPTHANSMALLVPVYPPATRFHFLVLLQNHMGFEN